MLDNLNHVVTEKTECIFAEDNSLLFSFSEAKGRLVIQVPNNRLFLLHADGTWEEVE